ncbi:hypothetical protein ADL02_06840 [Streptomyces sp. NRRL WC-3723]|nr:hypothetical protein ADL02_06840 [Streptomyces sp. NRRL WC-3723]
MYVLRVAGGQFEANVSYSAVNQALLPLAHLFDELSSTHQDALNVAAGASCWGPFGTVAVL